MVSRAALNPQDVVVTGRGIVSPIGNSLEEALEALRVGRSGLSIDPEFKRLGFRCHVAGRVPNWGLNDVPDEALTHSMSRTSLYSTIAAIQAVGEAGLTEAQLQMDETGVIIGCGISSVETIARNVQTMIEHGSPRRIGSHGADRAMASTCAANAAVYFRTRGIGEAVSSACATGLHNIGYAYRLVKHGYQNVVLCGAAEEDGWGTAHAFDAMRVLCADSNDHPERASRPLDATRSGFIPSGGAGIVVIESAAHALARGAQPFARIAGYWSATDGSGNMTAPSAEGQCRVMRSALESASLPPAAIDYVNLHATSTPIGDVLEMLSLVDVLGETPFLVSSSKSQIGHALGAAGAIELVFCLLMLEHGFVAPSINIEHLDPALRSLRHHIATTTVERPLRYLMTNNFGFGGTNACMILERVSA
jgi:3-oxoacyl-[acyl-carrier-protein] synthase I